MASAAKEPGGRATIKDVARLAGVDPGTVSRTLNPRTRSLVRDSTATRILEVVDQLGYRANSFARGLKTNRSFTIGVLIPDLTNPLFPPIVQGLQARLEREGYTVLLGSTDNDAGRAQAEMSVLRSQQVDGIIAATARRHDEVLDDFAATGVPLVLVNRHSEGRLVTSVAGDDRAGMRLAVDHLADLGHRRIAFIGGPLEVSTGFQRHQGFLEAMGRRDLTPDPGLVLAGQAFSEEEGVRLCRELFATVRPFTAIAASNDLMALGCYDVISENGLSCPDDVSVVGFNDMTFADRFNPPMTTVRIPHQELGEVAADLLLELIGNPQAEPRQVLLDPRLMVRRSTAEPAQPALGSLDSRAGGVDPSGVDPSGVDPSGGEISGAEISPGG
jgi:LacI family transcriptional regulator